MNSKKGKKYVNDFYEFGVSANECTGLLQHVELDLDEIAKYHKEFTKDIIVDGSTPNGE